MNDYIHRQDALECVTYDVEYTTEQIKGLPAEDVAPVRHARWERYSGITIRCSRCEHVIHDWRLSECKYCPNCGAKMDGERKE